MYRGSLPQYSRKAGGSFGIFENEYQNFYAEKEAEERILGGWGEGGEGSKVHLRGMSDPSTGGHM